MSHCISPLGNQGLQANHTGAAGQPYKSLPHAPTATQQVFSSLRAAKCLVNEQRLRPLLLLHPDALPEFDGVDTSSPNAVVLGLAKEAFTYDRLNEAFRLLLEQPEAPLIAIHRGRYLRVGTCRRLCSTLPLPSQPSHNKCLAYIYIYI